jgi:hypothetical protein
MSEMKLVDFDDGLTPQNLQTQGREVAARVVEAEGGKRLRLEFGRDPESRMSLLGPGKGWDVSDFVSIDLEVTNVGQETVALHGWLNDKDWIDGFAVLEPGQTDTLGIVIKRTKQFPGMNGVPGGHVTLWEEADPAHLSRISIAAPDATGSSVVEITSVRAVGQYIAPPEQGVRRELLPFVDRYGQYRHAEWPGKTHSDEDLAAQKAREDQDLDEHAGPGDWDRYGGWAGGPKLKATGHFRVAKHEGKWWLVDPEGRLFWSHGPDCIGLGQETKVEGREQYFESLDDRFRDAADYDFGGQNLACKHGASWQEVAVERAHRRLRSWGMNTVANWSEERVYLARRTPYFVAIHYGGPGVELGEFPYRDLKAFRQALRERLEQEKGKTAEDPWCIGYFVDNELTWPKGCADFADDYYRICREEVKRVAPDTLYLGSRLHAAMSPFGGPEEVVRAAAKHCDVVSFNRYRFSPSDMTLPEGVDKPTIIGEFHWGALDRGLLHPGLRSVANQRQRAATYQHYLRQALLHPNLVGAHWFQYWDQMVTGRFDGENYQVGLIDICDTPHWETIAACRAVGYEMYRIRSQG